MTLVIRATAAFEKQAGKLLSEEALAGLYAHLLVKPDAGDIIPGTGGIRKLRWKSGLNNRGKSGGVRILYHYTRDVLVLLVGMYAKSQQENISQQVRNSLKAEIPDMVAQEMETLDDENKSPRVH